MDAGGVKTKGRLDGGGFRRGREEQDGNVREEDLPKYTWFKKITQWYLMCNH